MSGSRKSSTSAFAPAAKNVGRPPVSYTVEDAVKLVRKSYWMTPAKLTSWIGKISSWHLSFVVTFLKLVREICTGTTFLSFHLSLSQQVVVNDVKPEVAIMAYGLQDELPCSTLYYKVRVAREKREAQQRHHQVADKATEEAWDCHRPYWDWRWQEPHNFSHHHAGRQYRILLGCRNY